MKPKKKTPHYNTFMAVRQFPALHQWELLFVLSDPKCCNLRLTALKTADLQTSQKKNLKQKKKRKNWLHPSEHYGYQERITVCVNRDCSLKH
jgi:hypothetical protein